VDDDRQDKRPASETPTIYVESLADRREGRIHGRWIDATQAAADIRRDIAEMLAGSATSHATEWAIRKHENFGRLHLRKQEDLYQLSGAAKLIAEHGPIASGLLHHLGGVQYVPTARRRLEHISRQGPSGRLRLLDDLLHLLGSRFLVRPERGFSPVPSRHRTARGERRRPCYRRPTFRNVRR
jgi:hypothetical protein